MSCHATFVMPRKMSSSYPHAFTYSYEGSYFTLDQGNSNNIPPACVLSTGAICPKEKRIPRKKSPRPKTSINQWTLCASYWSKPPTNHLMATSLTIIQSTDSKMNVKEIKFPYNYFFQKNFTGISGRAAMLEGGPCTLIPIIANSAPNLAN